MMKIDKFQSSDSENAINIAHLVWGNFYDSESVDVQNLIRHLTVKFYDQNRDFSYSIYDENNDYKGFIFAAKKNDENNCNSSLNELTNSLKNEDERSVLTELCEFLQYCGSKTKNHMSQNDIMLLLFVSTQKGCGKMLLSQLINDCKKQNIENIYLWSDTTCDYDYYQKNEFELLEKFDTVLNNKKVTIFIYKKNLLSNN